MIGYAWRFNRGTIKRVSWDLTGTLSQDSHGQKVADQVEFMMFWNLLTGSIFIMGFSPARTSTKC